MVGPKHERFSSRIGFILAALGMAIGTGNIWRFPRVAAAQGGGAFVLVWLLALFVWSIPLLALEMVIGRTTRRGVVEAFHRLANARWMGAWVAWVSTAIAFYYSVVAGWCLYYALVSAVGGLARVDIGGAEAVWSRVESSPLAVVFSLLAVGLAGLVVARGVARGIERANKVMIPSLFVVLLFLAIWALSTPGAERGLGYLFGVNPGDFLRPRLWLEAFSQSAWSTGAGWGLLLTYSIYTREKEDIPLSALSVGLGNNLASILAALAVVPTVFALLGPQEAQAALGSGNEGLSFIWLPVLFSKMPLGYLVQVLFFVALSMAALSSLISLIELPTRVVSEWGPPRPRATLLVAGVVFLASIPSALNISFLKNQDWVWGVGLLVSGAFFSVALWKAGLSRLAGEMDKGSLVRVGKAFGLLVGVVVPGVFVALLGWWLAQSLSWDPKWWWPISKYSLATVFLQWGLALAAFLIVDRLFGSKS